MTDPKPDRRDVDEAEVACRSFVVPSSNPAGVFELVEAALDHVTKPIESMIYADAHLAGLAHRNLGQDIAFIHGFPNAISIITSICQQHARFWQVTVHHQIETQIVGRLPRRDVRSHWQAMRVDAEVDLGRKPTSRTAKTLSRSPPFAPAA